MSEQGQGQMMKLTRIDWPEEEPMKGRPWGGREGQVVEIVRDLDNSKCSLVMSTGSVVTIPVIMEMSPVTEEEIAEMRAAQEAAIEKQQQQAKLAALDKSRGSVIALPPRPGEIETLAAEQAKKPDGVS